MKHSSPLKNLAVLGVLLAFLLLSGCVRPTVEWTHNPDLRTYNFSGSGLSILPIDDQRIPKNETRPWWYWMPGVLWATETDQSFDRKLAGDAHDPYTAQILYGLTFDADRDLQEAMMDQLTREARFNPVFRIQPDGDSWKNAPKDTAKLETVLRELSTRTIHLRYGLGPLAFLAHACGAPTEAVSVKIDMTWNVNGGGRAVNGAYSAEDYFVGGLYNSNPALQRALDQVSGWLSDAMHQMESTYPDAPGATDATVPSTSNQPAPPNEPSTITNEYPTVPDDPGTVRNEPAPSDETVPLNENAPSNDTLPPAPPSNYAQ
jgi:hypothetical protein